MIGKIVATTVLVVKNCLIIWKYKSMLIGDRNSSKRQVEIRQETTVQSSSDYRCKAYGIICLLSRDPRVTDGSVCSDCLYHISDYWGE